MKEELDVVVERFLPKIKKMARRLRAQFPKATTDDLQQAGTEGLLKAWDRYDPEKGKLGTFAHTWIKGEMLMHVRNAAAKERYENEANDAVDEAFQKNAIGSGNSLADAVLEIAETFAINAYSRRTPEDELLTGEAIAAVEAFFAELPERDREFFRLRYTEDLTLEEIGTALGFSRAALCRLEQRLRQQLRRRLDGGG